MTDRPADQADPRTTTGRVLVLLDGSRMSYAALQAAVGIAAKTGADVPGGFVGEVNSLRSTGQ